MKFLKVLSLVGIYTLALNAQANISASSANSNLGLITDSITAAPSQIVYHFVARNQETGSHASDLGSNISASVGAPFISTFGVFVYGGSCISQLKGQVQWQGGEGDCGSAITSSIAISLSTVLLLKEEVAHVEVDAYAFLAGEELTLALEEVIEKAKNEVPSYSEMNDAEVIAHLMAIKDIQL